MSSGGKCRHCGEVVSTDAERVRHLVDAHVYDDLSRIDQKRIDTHRQDSSITGRLDFLSVGGVVSRRRTLATIGLGVAGFAGSFSLTALGSSNPTEIHSWDDLDEIRDDLDGDYLLKTDLDAGSPGYDDVAGPDANAEEGWDPVGEASDPFTGSLDGNGHTIEDLVIDLPDSDEVGFFHTLDGATVESVRLEDVEIHGGDYTGTLAMHSLSGSDVFDVSVTGTVEGNSHVGGLIRLNDGRIESSSVEIDLTATDSYGGIVVENDPDGTIIECTAKGTVEGGVGGGGLAGGNTGWILHSGAQVDVNGTSMLGGLVGLNTEDTSLMYDVYATGDVSGTSDYVGGLIGKSDDGTISSGFATGSVDGGDQVGGLVGMIESAGELTDAYAVGLVGGNSTPATSGGLVGENDDGTLTDLYWDEDTTDQSAAVGTGDDDGTTGRTTADMQGSTPLPAPDGNDTMSGFDFTDDWYAVIDGEQINPTPEADGYPILQAIDAETQLAAMGVSFTTGDALISIDAGGDVSVSNIIVGDD